MNAYEFILECIHTKHSQYATRRICPSEKICLSNITFLKAREVLKWKSLKPEEANKIWSALAQVTEDIYTHFGALSALAKV